MSFVIWISLVAATASWLAYRGKKGSSGGKREGPRLDVGQ